jgi:thiamine-phosphate pyrophosphorylase
MNAIDLSLYLVVDPDLCGGAQGVVETARSAAANGATVVQLRAPGWHKRQWLATAQALKTVLAPYAVPLIINDQVDVALAVDADGVHVGQSDLPATVVRSLIGAHKVLGLSVSDAAELAAVPAGVVDYLGIGPVFPTGTKTDAAAPCGLPDFAELVRASAWPVVAIGGIDAARCAPLFSCGAAGIAVVSAICGRPDPAAATRCLRREIDTVRRMAASRGRPMPPKDNLSYL